MTERIIRPERHVPEDELHAYCDQALSRSQCAEIETHLSHCELCQAQRAAVAAFRDQTTALLAQLSPRAVITPPPFQVMLDHRSRQLQFAMWRVRFQRAAWWAAGIAAATGFGWLGRTVLDPHRTLPSAPIAEASAPVTKPAGEVVAITPREGGGADLESAAPAPVQEPEPAPSPGAGGRRASGPSATAASHQLVSFVSDLGPVTRESTPAPAPEAREERSSPFNRIWRMLPWEDALRVAGGGLPFIEGMTVVGVLMRPGAAGERPTVIVAQQDSHGEVIQSIEGPADLVDDVLRRQPPDIHISEAIRTPPDYVELPGGELRRTNRVLTITGRLPMDSLNMLVRMAMIR